ncbi:hypothetical protein LLEC1_02451 [Akanthomyces lecanii]|uniref:FAD-binding domain-containing protein n=1 Tax=Cordyceps confragosa TaxID=2714763 RepID=A0A179II65_CORDF|nr:hypothetical protein LLEC1_02451 [Akanthomyces lecanii]
MSVRQAEKAETSFSTAFPLHEHDLTRYPSRSVDLLGRLMQHGHDDSFAAVTKTSSQLIGQKTAQVPLQIVIVGAGLGGLSAAIALARRGNQVTVLEQAEKLGEIGAGIQLPPNSTRLLEEWGVTAHFQDAVVEPDAITLRRWENGTALGITRLVPDFRFKFGGPYYLMHRADFHTALVKCARQLGVEIRTASRIISYNSDADIPSVETVDGRVFAADLIVAADGIKSLARSTILGGKPSPPLNTGFAAYRATVDTSRMREHADLRWLVESPNINLWIGENHHVMTYCISGGKKFNMVLSHPEDGSTFGGTPEGSQPDMEATLAAMRKQFAGWDPVLEKVIHMIDSTMKWPMLTGSRLQTWTSESKRIILLGDAAHAMLPYMSQGAAMAVEDAAALAEALGLIGDKSQIRQAVDIYESKRMKRAYGMQSASLVNGKLWHFADGSEQEARDKGMRAEVCGTYFSESTNQWSDPVTQNWTYGYDAVRAIQEAWDLGASTL